MKNPCRFFRLIICFFLVGVCAFSNPLETFASSDLSKEMVKREFKRSFESLRDLDYNTWQVVVYSSPDYSGKLILRIIGYPGDLRIDHPTNLIVSSGRKNWNLNDITLENYKLVKNMRDGAAEFEITPLITSLNKNRPLMLSLKGVFTDLAIPPYLVAEWRSLIELNND